MSVHKLLPVQVGCLLSVRHLQTLLFGLFIALFFVSFLPQQALAVVNQEVSFQGKVVDKTNGTNISPACVASGASNDTCDFRVTIYDAPSGGTALWSEIHTDVEIGHYSGVFSLSIGSYCITNQGGSWTTDGDGGGSRCTVSGGGVDWGADATIYLLVELDTANTAGANSFASPEVFSRKLLTTVPFAFHAEEAANLEGLAANSFVQLAPNAAQTTGNTSNTLIHLNENGTGTPDLLDLQVAAGSVFKVNNSGAVAVGWGTNTGAWLAVSGSTTSRAHLRLSSGADPSAPASGDLWWNGTNLNFNNGVTTYDLLGSSSLFTDGGSITYLTSTTDDFAIGGTSLASPFSVDESANTVRIGEGSGSSAILNMYASNGATGSITYTTSDEWLFTDGNITVGGNITPQTTNTYTLGSGIVRWDSIFVGTRVDIQDGSSNGGAIITEAGDALVVTDAGEIVLRPGTSASADILSAMPVAAAGASSNLLSTTATLNAMDGTDTVRGYYLNLTNGNHTGATNNLYGIDIAAITGDAEATEYALQIGTGWDRGISAAGTIAFTSLTSCSSGIQTDGSGVLSCAGAGSSLFTDGGTVTYLTATTDDFAIGGTTLASAFSVDESANTVRIGDGAGTNGVLSMYASDGDTGTLTYTTDDSFAFENANVGIGTQNPGGILEVANTGSTINLLVSSSGTGTGASISYSGTGTTTDGIVIANTSTGAITDALDLSDAEIVNALNLGANNIVMTDGGTVLWNDSAGNNLIEVTDIATNFGAYFAAGATVSLNSYIGEEFNRDEADLTGDAILDVGDTDMWSFDENTDCTVGYLDDSINGVLEMTAIGTSNCLLHIGGTSAATDASLILDADALPLFLIKARPSTTTTLNYRFGMSDTGTSAATDPTNGIYFTRNGTAWRGVTRSGGTSTNVDCSGSTISTTNYALFKIEVRSTTDVRFYVDDDVSNGVSWNYCGQSTTNIPTAASTAHINVNSAAGTVYVDFFRIWQDDPQGGSGLDLSAAGIEAMTEEDVVSGPAALTDQDIRDYLTKQTEIFEQMQQDRAKLEAAQQKLPSLFDIEASEINFDLPVNFTNDVVFKDSLQVLGNANFAGNVRFDGQVIFDNLVKFTNTVYLSSDMAGQAVIPAGASSVEVSFSQDYGRAPVVMVSPLDELPGSTYTVASISGKGFRINLSNPESNDIKLSWLALFNE